MIIILLIATIIINIQCININKQKQQEFNKNINKNYLYNNVHNNLYKHKDLNNRYNTLFYNNNNNKLSLKGKKDDLNNDEAVRFYGWPSAITSQNINDIIKASSDRNNNTLNIPITTLSTKEDKIRDVQILYKRPKTFKLNHLVKVNLEAEKTNITLYENFDMIAQECSCYYINVQEINKNNNLEASDKYYLRFFNNDLDIRSGYFKIKTN